MVSVAGMVMVKVNKRAILPDNITAPARPNSAPTRPNAQRISLRLNYIILP